MTRRLTLAVAVLALVAGGVALAAPPAFPEFKLPHLYGRVVLDQFTKKAGMAPVAFDHWSHRVMFTCRVCHVDVGFVMQAGASEISAATNQRNLHCGACHNGRTRYGDVPIFAACSDAPPDKPEKLPGACSRCHRRETDAQVRKRYQAFAKAVPRDPSGVIDWERLEASAFEKPVDFVEGVSLRAAQMKNDHEFSIAPVGTWLGEITFSHQKHARWSGCEGCHPEIFPTTARGGVAFKMTDIVAGRYCGVCHNTVAFPLSSCLRCHRVDPGRASQAQR